MSSLGLMEIKEYSTGVLFDLLCAEPERPWNLTVHFRAPPGDILIPCDGEDSVKWSFINSLKEAAYIINGNCKNIMNMSQADQSELWQSLIKGNMDGYARVSSRLKIGPFGDDAAKPTSGNESTGTARSSRIPVRLYLRVLGDDEDDLEDVTAIDSHYVTFKSAMRSLLPDLFVDKGDEIEALKDDVETIGIVESIFSPEESKCLDLEAMKPNSPKKAYQIKTIRVQGIEVEWDLPFFWVFIKKRNKNAIKTLRRRWEGERYGFGGEGVFKAIREKGVRNLLKEIKEEGYL
ncbi:hypothetical protein HPP92_002577 [Vanilla planifolia]|nr:hypothetical protein HPP92_002577 [Vanilla planifolia]